MPERAELRLAARRCDQCLTTRNRIVSGDRAAEIVSDCRRTGNHFVCHKGSIAGEIVHCRGVHDILIRDFGGSTAYQFATRIGVPIVEVDPEDLGGDHGL